MILSFGVTTLLLTVAATIDSSFAAGKVQVLENVLDPRECETFRQAAAASSSSTEEVYSGRLQGYTRLSLDLAHRFHQALHPNKHCVCAGGGIKNHQTVSVITSTITKTTAVHQDHHQDGKLAAEQVGFVFLNDNPNASFLYGNGEKVSVEQGKLVTFQGDVPHHTTIRSGQVHLLGPFAMSSFHPVGRESECIDDNCPDCAGEEGCENDEFICTCLESSGDGYDDYGYDFDLSSKGGQRCLAFSNEKFSLCIGDCDSCACCPDTDGSSIGGPYTCECTTSASPSSSKSSKANAGREIRALSSKSSKGDECGASTNTKCKR